MSSINAIFNANVYINGNSQIGRASEVKLPEIEISTDEYKGLGLVGTIKVPSGVEALEGEITWNSFFPDAFVQIYDPFSAVQLMIRSDVQVFNAAGLAEQVQMTTMVTATFSKNPLGNYKPKEKA